jgi:hypothetical protein
MKKAAIIIIAVISILGLSQIVGAGFAPEGQEFDLRTRLEVSKDGSNWYNYTAESNPGNQTLTVSPGDTITMRLKTWDVGSEAATNIGYTSSFTNPSYFSAFYTFGDAGANADVDGDATLYYNAGTFDMSGGTFTFTLDGVDHNTTINSGEQSGQVTATIGDDAVDQGVILVTAQITDATEPPVIVGFLDRLFPKALADAQATTQVRMIVSNPQTIITDTTLTQGKGQ